MVEATTSTGFTIQQNSWATNGGTRLSPQMWTRPAANDTWQAGVTSRPPATNWTQNQGKITYHDSDWAKPTKPGGTNAGVNGGFGTDEWGEKPSTGGTTQPKSGQFVCLPLPGGGSTATQATTEGNMGQASGCLNQLTFKIFSPSICPGQVLYGIVYLDVKEPISVSKINIKMVGELQITLGQTRKRTFDSPGKTFILDAVTTTNSANTLKPDLYVKKTEDFSGDDLISRLSLLLNPATGDNSTKAFSGPISLPVGTHAIPFGLRIPSDAAPTIKFSRTNKTDTGKVAHTTTVMAELALNVKSSGSQINMQSGKLPLQVKSCGSLPPILDGKYTAGDSLIIDLPYKNSKGLVLLEKKNHILKDTVAIYMWVSDSRAVRHVSAKLVQATNFPELKLSDQDVTSTTRINPNLKLLDRTANHNFHTHFDRRFTSTVSKIYPITNTSQSHEQPINDKSQLPESNRDAGLKITLNTAHNPEPTLLANDTRISYHVILDLSVKGQRKSIVREIPITLNEELM